MRLSMTGRIQDQMRLSMTGRIQKIQPLYAILTLFELNFLRKRFKHFSTYTHYTFFTQ